MARIPILVTEPEFHRAQAVFQEASDLECIVMPPDEAELAAAVRSRSIHGVVVGSKPYRDALYDSLAGGGVIARFGVGFDNIDLRRATESRVICTNTPDVLEQSVAELTMSLVLAAARHLISSAGDMQRGLWAQRQGIELSGRTIAIIGWGRIGRVVARIARQGFGMRVVACRRSKSAETSVAESEHADLVTDDFTVAVRDADFVSVHIPSTPANVKFIDARRLAALSPRAWIINTARGAVLDEVALFDALAAGRLAGAALDVFAHEPYVPADASHDLRTLPHVLLTPHIGSHTVEANRRMALRALANVRSGATGDVGRMDVINPEVLDTLRDLKRI